MPINSWTINLALGLVLSIIVGGGYYVWKTNVQEAAVAELRIQELQKELAAQEKLVEDLTAINKEGNELIADLKNKEINLNQKLSDLEVYLKNNKDTTQSSEVLKRTFKDLAQ